MYAVRNDLADTFQHGYQTTLGACSSVSMDQVLARRAINFFLSDNVLGLCQIAIARRNRLSHSADLRPHAAFSGSVLYPTLVVLAKSFLGAGCIRHISGGRGSRVEDRGGGMSVFFRPRSMAIY